ncbi:RapZ C-terminal domain-containing protein [Desulfurivibrio alkaliphilus]|uniref:RapZ C-terminal domain-containing protein n=1 Tax=Desulfurivibrio alkaliphilus (strain DSM 19089 / UNIQEM U267 / AHT2) TaxID=589865 RepID=D6Z6A4_DESAT|nr:RNase adapter RapZ [Desulfurivibrio alkaliphilus]ADH86869.1 conserved hypothetical protein [Desulfurivibrio alkaliphilus AHT 2]
MSRDSHKPAGRGEPAATGQPARLPLTLQSFGHKHGPAPAADLVFDARPLPNPYWQEELRPHHGLEPEIAAYVLEHPAGKRFIALHLELLHYYLQLETARANHRDAIAIAVGCTGGRHRSPAVTEALAAALRATELPLQISTRHRDIDKQ